MCDPMTILGIGSGVLTGVIQAQGEKETARKNRKMIRDQQRAEMAQKQRELIIESNAANKEGYKASREQAGAVGLIKAAGEGMGGFTMGQRVSDQNAQGSLSIQAAKDRAEAGQYNYAEGTQVDAIEARNKIAVNTPSKGAMFANIVTSGINGYSQFR